jgi:hypothetical protein
MNRNARLKRLLRHLLATACLAVAAAGAANALGSGSAVAAERNRRDGRSVD